MHPLKRSAQLHDIPDYLNALLSSDNELRTLWDTLTPLAKNEWICWVSSAKKEETRLKRLGIAQTNIKDGKKRPCCWPGCPHFKIV